MNPQSKSAWLVRVDKIGDLVLSLSLDESAALTEYNCTWLISEGLAFVPNFSVKKKHFFEIKKQFGLNNFLKLLRLIRIHQPQLAVILYAPWWVALAFWLARTPLRIGRKSQWYSYLFFNYGVRQSRSLSEFHESEYNQKLLEEGLKQAGHKFTTSSLPYLQLSNANSLDVLSKFNLKKKNYLIIHPGMFGSALNWPLQSYKNLILFLKDKIQIVITGTATDQNILKPLQTELSSISSILWLNERLTTTDLIAVLQEARAVIAPSTGVLHLAAATGTPVVGIYSPRTPELARRWGPRGPHAITLSPNKIPKNPSENEQVMSGISTEQVLHALIQVAGPLP